MAILKAQIRKKAQNGNFLQFQVFLPPQKLDFKFTNYLSFTDCSCMNNSYLNHLQKKNYICMNAHESSVFALDLHISKRKKNPIKSIFVTLLYDFALKHFSGNEFKRSIEVRNYVTPQSLTSRAGFKNSDSPSPILRLMVKNVHWFFSKYSFLNDTHFSLRDYFSSPKKICSKVHSLIKHVNLKRQTDNSE